MCIMHGVTRGAKEPAQCLLCPARGLFVRPLLPRLIPRICMPRPHTAQFRRVCGFQWLKVSRDIYMAGLVAACDEKLPGVSGRIISRTHKLISLKPAKTACPAARLPACLALPCLALLCMAPPLYCVASSRADRSRMREELPS